MFTTIYAIFISIVCVGLFIYLSKKDKKTMTDTIKWFNTTYALFTFTTGGNLNKIGGSVKSKLKALSNQTLLEEGWGITSKDGVDNTLKWLLNEGHNEELLDEYYSLEEYTTTLNDYLDDLNETEKLIAKTILEAHSKYGDRAILGWDLARAMQIISNAYIADYYTYEETMDRFLKFAKIIQENFKSWEEFVDSYLLGHRYWFYSNFDIEDIKNINPKNMPNCRRELYTQLKNSKDNPYTIPWHTTLEKTW